MDRETVDFGIDLGTTNSAVARAASVGAAVVKNRFQSDTTPSAVARTRSGQSLVGQDALNKPNLSPVTKFKRQMGSDASFSLTDGSDWLPEQLSAEILKELKAAVSQRFDREMTSAVITIPAMFQQPQCEATYQAAQMAGIDVPLLLQEPIAAATWYLNEDQRPGHYVVYDLGGGTFDVSIVRLKDNEMSVVAHGGDNYLGGSDFDRRIAEWVTEQIERRHGHCPELEAGVKRFLLYRECERARITLSTHSDTIIDLSDLDVPIYELPLSRTVLEGLIAGDVDRTVRLLQERLDQASLRTRDIERLILVGGPTMTPLVRQKVKELGIPAASEQDPMTVVALGAAVHASSLLRKNRGSSRANVGTAQITLHYDPVVADTLTSISGRVESPAGLIGEIRLESASRDWDSGWVSLRNSSFVLDLPLRPGANNEFAIALRDATGSTLSCAPASVSIRNGIAAATAISPYDYGVALEDGSFKIIVREGTPLPATGSVSVHISQDLFAGAENSCPIYVLEGHSRIASDNTLVGTVHIKGSDLTRRIRKGELVEIRIRMDESRRLTAKVLVPVLDLEYATDLNSRLVEPDVNDIEASLSETELLVGKIRDVVVDQDVDKLSVVSRNVEIIEADIERAKEGDKDAANSSISRLSKVKAELRDLSARYEAQATYQRALGMIGHAERMCENFDDRLGIATLRDLRTDAGRHLQSDNVKALEAIHERAEKLYWQHYLKTPECFVDWLSSLRDERRFATNDLEYDEYLKRAESCLSRGDLEGVRVNALKATSYLPDEKQKENRFSDTLIKG